MAATMHDQIRLGTTLSAQLPTSQFDLLVEGDVQKPYAAVVSERGLTGTLHVHRVMDGSSPKTYMDYPYILLVDRDEYDTLKALRGKVIYFLPNWYDDSDPASYRKVVLFKTCEPVQSLTPQEEYFKVSIFLEDATGLTVDS